MPFEAATKGVGLSVSDMFAVKMVYSASHGSRYIYYRPFELSEGKSLPSIVSVRVSVPFRYYNEI